jgi:hypothetical protein
LYREHRLAIAAVAIFSAAMATGKPAAPALTNTEAFQGAFAQSFKAFDGCGDPANGALYRKALTEKVESCPFTPDAKAAFRQWTQTETPKATADLQRYVAEHDKLPPSLDAMKVRCTAQQRTPVYQATLALMGRYAKGEVKFDAVVPDRCDIKAGGPGG